MEKLSERIEKTPNKKPTGEESIECPPKIGMMDYHIMVISKNSQSESNKLKTVLKDAIFYYLFVFHK